MNAIARSGFKAVFTVFATLFAGGCSLQTVVASKPTAVPEASKQTPPLSINAIRYSDVSQSAGLNFHWPTFQTPLRINDAIAGGCGCIDYDNDGWQDILLVSPERLALYRNCRNGKFEDKTVESGLSKLEGKWMGCAIADVDGDGRLDILLTGMQRLALLHNQDGSKFEDWTVQSGLDPANHGHWGLSAGFMDLDGSGNLSLLLTNYVTYSPSAKQYCELQPGVQSGCPPTYYPTEYPELWRNTGNGKFRNITDSSGIKPLHGQAMVVAFTDFDNDGRMDFYIGNDGKPAELERNLGGMRFENVGVKSGVAYNNMGHAIAAMGADWGDYDNDQRPDLAITAFSDEPYSLWNNKGLCRFDYASETTQLSAPTYSTLGFGAKWVDMDNDGWLDLAIANGHVYDNASVLYPQTTFLQPIMLFHNMPAAKGREFADIAGDMPAAASPILGRGLAVGDYDNDGRMDILVVDLHGGPKLLQNGSDTRNHWLKLDLRQKTGNRFAYGARVTVDFGSHKLTQFVSPAASFLSSNDPRLNFGLGSEASFKKIDIRWPDGTQQTVQEGPADRIVTIVKK